MEKGTRNDLRVELVVLHTIHSMFSIEIVK